MHEAKATWVQKDPLEEGMANPLQYSWLENPGNRGTWWATVHGITNERLTTKV